MRGYFVVLGVGIDEDDVDNEEFLGVGIDWVEYVDFFCWGFCFIWGVEEFFWGIEVEVVEFGVIFWCWNYSKIMLFLFKFILRFLIRYVDWIEYG